MTLERRDLLRSCGGLVCGAGVAAAAAGATATPGPVAGGAATGRGSRPPTYGNWLPDPDETAGTAPVQAAYSATTSALVESGALDDAGEDGPDPPPDPMVANPAVGGSLAAVAWLELREAGLAEPVLGPAAGGDAPEPADVPVTRTVSIGSETRVYLGSFDATALTEAVDAEGFSESGDGVYVHPDEGTAVTWTDEAVVVAPEARRVEAVAGAGTGDVPRHHETNEAFAWLLETGGAGGFTIVAYSTADPFPESGGDDSTDEDYSMFGGCRGFAQSANVADGTYTTATTAAVYDDADAVRRDRLESGLGTDATERSVRTGDARVTVQATFAVVTPESTPTPTATPTDEPTEEPTDVPTDEPTDQPTEEPTDAPTAEPTATPTDPAESPTATDPFGGTDAGPTDTQGGSGGSGPGMGALAGIASLLGAGSLLARRSGGGESR